MIARLPQWIERCIAIDLHKHYLVVGGVNREQNIVLQPRRMNFDEWAQWYPRQLQPTDALVVESTTNAWGVYDQIAPLVGLAVVANPIKLALIGQAKVRTDKKAVLHLAQLLAANVMPAVWVPPEPVRQLRSLLAHRRRLVQERTRLRNRLHSVLHRHNLKPPGKGSLFAEENRTWWSKLDVSPPEQFGIHHDLERLEQLARQVDECDSELARLSTAQPWAELSRLLMQLPGFGLITTMTVLAAIGEVERFEHAKKLVGYAGLGSGVHASGQTQRTGRITKEGRGDLRWAMVEVSHKACQWHPYWKAEFERLSRRLGAQLGKQKAKVAIARKLLVAVWHVLSKQTTDRHSDVQSIAYKFFSWSYKLGPEHFAALGLNRRQFVRYQLIRLGIGNELKYLARSGVRRRIAPVEQVLALRPELASAD